RFRDFTPRAWTLPGPFAVDNPMARLGTGGADRFISAIVDEMLPEVRARLPIDDARVGVCGWSLSGLCAAHAWLSRPEVFSDLVAISPSLWWHDAVILTAPIPTRPASHRAVITAGQHEEGDPDRVWPRIFVNQPQRATPARDGGHGAQCGTLWCARGRQRRHDSRRGAGR
ncbi:MAG: alpha/beta hydrolase, partial [Gammaproteobacteria bacterium]